MISIRRRPARKSLDALLFTARVWYVLGAALLLAGAANSVTGWGTGAASGLAATSRSL